ncbi:hypothetical protein OF83DRAFT_1130960 [Amylostereum chailletii]|nr:hypothetical protein OF83DRAFT_1130960 [Amylostereum chailletii]
MCPRILRPLRTGACCLLYWEVFLVRSAWALDLDLDFKLYLHPMPHHLPPRRPSLILYLLTRLSVLPSQAPRLWSPLSLLLP